MISVDEKLKPDPIAPIFFRIKKPLNDRLKKVCDASGRDRNTLARAGLEAEIARMEAQASPLSPATARLVAEAMRLGVDVPQLIRVALEKPTVNP